MNSQLLVGKTYFDFFTYTLGIGGRVRLTYLNVRLVDQDLGDKEVHFFVRDIVKAFIYFGDRRNGCSMEGLNGHVD